MNFRRSLAALTLAAAVPMSFVFVACTDAPTESSDMGNIEAQAGALQTAAEVTLASNITKAQSTAQTSINAAMSSEATARKLTLSGTSLQVSGTMTGASGTVYNVNLIHSGTVVSATEAAAPASGIHLALLYVNAPADATLGQLPAGFYEAVYFPGTSPRLELRDSTGAAVGKYAVRGTNVSNPDAGAKIKVSVTWEPGTLTIDFHWTKADAGAANAIAATISTAK